jgi:drug/metabolite transporter (DMT)-like permease
MRFKDQRILGVVLAVTTALLWGVLAIGLKIAMNRLEPMTIVWFRFLLAFSILLAWYTAKQPSFLKILVRPPVLLMAASLALGINYIAFMYGLKFTSAGTSQIIIQIGPIMLGVVGFVFFRETISRRQALGFLIAGAGLTLFYLDNIMQYLGHEELYNMGILWIVVSAMSWVVYATFQKMLVRSYPAMQLNLFIFGLPVIIFLPFAKFSAFLTLDFTDWLLIIFLGLNTLISYSCLTLSFKYLEANKISMIITMNPIVTFVLMGFAAYFGVAWLQPEVITFRGIIAALLVIVGGVLAVAFANPNKKKEIKYWMEEKNPDEPIKNEPIKK